MVELPRLRAAGLAVGGGHPRRVDAEGALPAGAVHGHDAVPAEHVHREDELAEAVAVAGADDEEVDGVGGVEGLDRPAGRPLPHRDELAGLGRGRPGRAEPDAAPVEGEGVGRVLGALGLGDGPGAGEAAGVVDEGLRRPEIGVHRVAVQPRSVQPRSGAGGGSVRGGLAVRRHPSTLPQGRPRPSQPRPGPAEPDLPEPDAPGAGGPRLTNRGTSGRAGVGSRRVRRPARGRAAGGGRRKTGGAGAGGGTGGGVGVDGSVLDKDAEWDGEGEIVATVMIAAHVLRGARRADLVSRALV